MSEHTEHPHQPTSYAYTQPFFAEFYDLWVTHLFPGPPDDTPLFERLVRAALASTSSGTTITNPQPVTVVDLATGTGRVLHALAHAFPSALTTDRLRLVGTDHSNTMLARSARNPPARRQGERSPHRIHVRALAPRSPSARRRRRPLRGRLGRAPPLGRGDARIPRGARRAARPDHRVRGVQRAARIPARARRRHVRPGWGR